MYEYTIVFNNKKKKEKRERKMNKNINRITEGGMCNNILDRKTTKFKWIEFQTESISLKLLILFLSKNDF